MLTDALRGGVRSAGFSRTAAICAGAALLIGGIGFGPKSASAQAIPAPAQRDFDLKVGVFIPAASDVRTASATLVPSVEGEYTIQKFPESSFVSKLGVGFIEHGPFRIIPFEVSQIYRDPNNNSSTNYYYGLGLGLYSTRLDLPDTDDRAKLLFGGFIVTGVDFTKTIFGELKFNYISKYDNKTVGGFQLSTGIRF